MIRRFTADYAPMGTDHTRGDDDEAERGRSRFMFPRGGKVGALALSSIWRRGGKPDVVFGRVVSARAESRRECSCAKMAPE